MNSRRPVAGLLVAVVVGLAALAALAVLRPDPPQAAGTAGAVAPAPSAARLASVAAAEVLHAWDRRRAAAWASGDPGALGSLYAPGSRSGRHDRAALAAYAGRGLRVSGLRMQLLAVSVEHWDARRLVVRVTDQISGSVTGGGAQPVALPGDEPSTWRIRWRRLGGEWRVAEVRRARQPAPP